jgi:hypothetical protein
MTAAPRHSNDHFDPRDPTVMPREATPLWITPVRAAMGKYFAVELKLPFALMRSVDVRENDRRGNFQSLAATLQPVPDEGIMILAKAVGDRQSKRYLERASDRPALRGAELRYGRGAANWAAERVLGR